MKFTKPMFLAVILALASVAALAQQNGLPAYTLQNPNASVTPSGNATFAGALQANSTIPAVSPYADIRAYGALCNGSSDDTPAFQSALNALASHGGVILIPGLGNGCYFANPTGIAWPSISGNLVIQVQGKLSLGSTLISPGLVDWTGQGGYLGAQFFTGPVAAVIGPSTTGALGTACSAGSSCTFTPSTMAGLHPGTAISIISSVSCSPTSLTRAVAVTGNTMVTAQLPGACHIAPGFQITVAGATDSTYNGTFTVAWADYVNNTLSWPQSGSASSTTGGTVSGYNEDTEETAILTATTASTATASFLYAHASTDTWGIAGMEVTGYAEHSLKNLYFQSSGSPLWVYAASPVALTQVSSAAFSPIQAVEFNESWQLWIDRSTFEGTRGGAGGTSYNVHFTSMNPPTGNNGGVAYFTNGSIVIGGIKADRDAEDFWFENELSEQPTRGLLTLDTSYNASGEGGYYNQQVIRFDSVETQDNFLENQQCLMYSLYPTTFGTVIADSNLGIQSPCIANNYWQGDLEVRGSQNGDYNGAEWGGSNSAQGVNYSANRHTETELVGEGASLGPSVIPYATSGVTPTSSWTGSPGCTATQGILSPDGTNDAVALSGASYYALITDYNTTWAVGDWIIFGGWEKVIGTPSGNVPTGTPGYYYVQDPYDSIVKFNYGYGTNYINPSDAESFPLANNWWHPVVIAAQVAASDGGTHQIFFSASCTSTPGVSIAYYKPFFIHIPASANIPVNEIGRWRQQLLHGIVPPNMAAGSLAIDPAFKLSWGSGTDLFADANGNVKTDELFNSAAGYQVAGNLVIPPTASGNSGGGTNVLLNGTTGAPVNPGVLAATTSMSGCASGTYMKADGSGCGTPGFSVATTVSSGAIAVSGSNNYVICTGACTVTPSPPAAGTQLCVRNAPGSAAVITLAALGAGNYYELTSHTGWGAANHTVVSGGLATDQLCLVGYDANHYAVFSYTGSWTD